MTERAYQGVGIDLGTTYSSLAYMDAQMTPRVVSDSEGNTVMPSVVYFDDDEVIVGEIALSMAKLDADRVAQFIKVNMGDNWRREFNGKVHTPESISALILGQLVREAEPQIGLISGAVITVPAYFTEKRRRATQQAGEIAGLNVLGTLNEPMAATLAYGLYRVNKEEIAVVYDLGGGTFDVTVVHIAPNLLEELTTKGNRQLGGRDWDQALIDYVCDDFKKKHGNDPREDKQAIQDLYLECERSKRRLGRMHKTSIRLHAFGHDHTSSVTKKEFEAITAHLLQTTKLTTELALEDANLTWKDVTRIVLVGGSTNMPVVRDMLRQASGISPDVAVNPVTAVALGAATYAHMLETGLEIDAIRFQQKVEELESVIMIDDDEAPSSLPTAMLVSDHDLAPVVPARPEVRFVTAHGVGLRVHTQHGMRNRVLIPSNTPVPASVTRRFTATGKGSGGAHIRIEITQGDSEDCELVEHLGTGRIELPHKEPPGNPVDVTMEFDRQSRLHTHAVYVKTGQEMSMTVDVKGCLHQNEVDDYRNFLVNSGFAKPFDSQAAIARLEEIDLDEDDDMDDDGLPMFEPILE